MMQKKTLWVVLAVIFAMGCAASGKHLTVDEI
jgi:hypothetical protein